MIKLTRRSITDVKFTFSPIYKVNQLTARLKHEAILKAFEEAERLLKKDGTVMGEMQFRFPRNRLPRRVKQAIVVQVSWEVLR